MEKKVTSESSLVDIAKAVRLDIKAAKEAGHLCSDLKVSVRKFDYAGGCSLSVNVTRCSFQIRSTEHLLWEEENPHTYLGECPHSRYTELAKHTLAVLGRIVRAYHWDRSDSMTDYYHVNFSFHGAEFDWELRNADERDTLARQELVKEAAAAAPPSNDDLEDRPEPAKEDAVEASPPSDDLETQLAEARAELEAATKVHAEATMRAEIARLRGEAAVLLVEAADLTANL